MRTELIKRTCLMVLCVLSGHASAGGEPSLLPQRLENAQLSSFEAPIYRQQLLKLNGRLELLVLTRDVGSGVELREAYVYAKDEAVWRLLAFRSATSASISAKVSQQQVELVGADGETILVIPLGSPMR